MKHWMGCCVVLLGTACTWVEPTTQGGKVTLVKAPHVTHCQALGSVSSTTKPAVAGIRRSEEKVAEELVDLARNKAAGMGGDTLVAEGPVSSGSQSFRVYRCG